VFKWLKSSILILFIGSTNQTDSITFSTMLTSITFSAVLTNIIFKKVLTSFSFKIILTSFKFFYSAPALSSRRNSSLFCLLCVGSSLFFILCLLLSCLFLLFLCCNIIYYSHLFVDLCLSFVLSRMCCTEDLN
jgi:hypothetical protein